MKRWALIGALVLAGCDYGFAPNLLIDMSRDMAIDAAGLSGSSSGSSKEQDVIHCQTPDGTRYFTVMATCGSNRQITKQEYEAGR